MKLPQIKDALRAAIELAEKATPGPWTWYWLSSTTQPEESDCGVFSEPRKGQAYSVCRAPRYTTEEQWTNNAAFIAHARTMHPHHCKALLETIELLEGMACDSSNEHLCDNDGRGCPACSAAERALTKLETNWPS